MGVDGSLPAGMRCEFPINCRQIFKNPLKKPYELITSHENRPPGQTTQWLYTIKPTDLITEVYCFRRLSLKVLLCGTGKKLKKILKILRFSRKI